MSKVTIAWLKMYMEDDSYAVSCLYNLDLQAIFSCYYLKSFKYLELRQISKWLVWSALVFIIA